MISNINNNNNISTKLQYTRIYNPIMQNTSLSSTSKLIYSRLCYRMQLSITKHHHFYNDKGSFYYVIYQIQDLMTDTGSGRRAVINALKQLVHYGLVVKHRLIHVMELELPKFQNVISRSAKRAPLNRIKNPKTKKSVNTINTVNRKKDQQTTKSWINRHWDQLKLRVTKTNLIRHYHLPKELIDHILSTSSNDYDAFKYMVGLLFKAKKSAFNHLNSKHKRSSKVINKCLSFEYNRCYSGEYKKQTRIDSLSSQYCRAFTSAKKISHKVSMKHPKETYIAFDKTIMKCLIKYFVSAGDLELINMPEQYQNQMNIPIPIFKI